MKPMIFTGMILLPLLLSACGSATATTMAEPATNSPETGEPIKEADMSFKLTSDAFANGQSIPAKYSCVGRNISPALNWGEPPAGTQSFALIMDDPDAPAGTWVHWVLYNIPAEARGLQEALPVGGENNLILVGKNSWGDSSYGGPCPPGGTHRYFFKLYALDIEFPILAPSATKEQVLNATKGHILAQTELMGTFSK